MKEGHIPKDERKKILLLCDDIRVHSGVATVTREIVINSCHLYNWVNVGGAINHPDKGKKLDISEDSNKTAGIEDASVFLYPTDGYGSPELIRQLIEIEKPDAIMLVTDPRYFTWLFNMENEIRKQMPIIYLNIWDDLPYPMWNKEFYESCDALFGISKQTVNINKQVLGKKAKNKVIRYVPHGLNENFFRPIQKDEELYKHFTDFKNNLLGGEEYDFIAFFNSRNIRRKQIQDTIYAFRLFVDQLPEEKAKKCALVLHTNAVDGNGTDLHAVIEYFKTDYLNVIISENKLDIQQMAFLYNMADVTMLLSSNEGWGLALTESLLSGTPIMANTTGGMQDQMRFEDENGNWIEFDKDFPSNHKGTYKKHGEWAFPLYPTPSIQGSPQTPYIFDDRCDPEDATKRLLEIYNMSKKERERIGLEGMKWALGDEAGFTSVKMTEKFIEGIEKLFQTWKPREKYELLADNDYEKRTLKHTLIY